MSGGGGGGGGGGSWPDEVPRDCDDVTFDVALSSPQPDVVGSLREEDQLLVELQTTNGMRTIVARTQAGQVAGTITTGQLLPNLIRCLQEGRTFVAIVRGIDGGHVRVRVQPG